MFHSKIKTYILFVVFVISYAEGQDRKITSNINPGCLHCKEDYDTLMYIRAEGSHDTIHQIWDFTGGVPTVILAVAGTNSTMNILWDGNIPREFNMSETPKYTFATAFVKLYEYNDTNDNGYIDDERKWPSVPLSHVSWRLRDSIRTEQEVMVQMHGLLDDRGVSGIIEVRLDFLPFKDYAIQLPHLIHTANSTLMDVSLVNLNSKRGYNASRFALNMLIVSADRPTDTMHYAMRKSLDDEHTPGIFEIIEIKSPESFSRNDGGFLQFRPVAYTLPERGVETSTVLHVSAFNRSKIESSTLDTFYLESGRDHLLVQRVLLSFGETADGFYKKTNYTSWSLTVGYGSPPLEGFSTFVIVIICIGLGAPLLLGAAAAAYACARRAAASRPQRFTDLE